MCEEDQTDGGGGAVRVRPIRAEVAIMHGGRGVSGARYGPAAGQPVVCPILAYRDVGMAIDWITQSFDAHERLRAVDGSVVTWAEVEFPGGALVMLRALGAGEPVSPSGHEVLIYVDDVDEHYQRVGQHARVHQAPTTKPEGMREYEIEDPEGHRWVVGQVVEHVDPRTWGAVVPPSA